MEAKYCIEICGEELNNEHLTCCKYLNEESDFRYQNILNGELKQKLDTFEQIKRNQEMRKEVK